MSIKFSIIVVSLNAGDRLKNTLDSIRQQTYKDYEVIIKDGCSTDGSIEIIKDYQDMPVKLYCMKDEGIYDAMNQGLERSTGEYIYYLNCGDYFASPLVLKIVADRISENSSDIYYGNIYERLTKTVVNSNPSIDEFACFRNVPCHQACFYKKSLIEKHCFDTKYKVRADYEQFLWCYFKADAKIQYIDLIVADYEGGGFSEGKRGLYISKLEHEEIINKYLSKSDIRKYKAIMALTLAPLRTAIAKNSKTAGVYNKLKKLIYKN